jgi:hypothetical protein
VAISGCQLDSFKDEQVAKTEPSDTTLNAEREAWIAQNVSEYWLTLIHTKGSKTYSTRAKIAENKPQYVKSGGVSAVMLSEEFHFQPLAETVQGIYNLAETAV